MRHKIPKIVFTTAIFSCLCLYALLPLSSAGPYTDKLESSAAVRSLIVAILNEDVDLLTDLSYMPESFHFGKREKVEKFLKNYFDTIIETRKIEIQSITVKNDHEAEALVSIHRFDRREDVEEIGIENTNLTPTEETWTFIKGKGSSFSRNQRGKWLFVLEFDKRDSAFY